MHLLRTINWFSICSVVADGVWCDDPQRRGLWRHQRSVPEDQLHGCSHQPRAIGYVQNSLHTYYSALYLLSAILFGCLNSWVCKCIHYIVPSKYNPWHLLFITLFVSHIFKPLLTSVGAAGLLLRVTCSVIQINRIRISQTNYQSLFFNSFLQKVATKQIPFHHSWVFLIYILKLMAGF